MPGGCFELVVGGSWTNDSTTVEVGPLGDCMLGAPGEQGNEEPSPAGSRQRWGLVAGRARTWALRLWAWSRSADCTGRGPERPGTP